MLEVHMVLKNYNIRAGEDGLIKGIRFMSLISWSLLFTVFLLIAKAKPAYETIFERFYTQVSPVESWDNDLIQLAMKLLIPLLILAFTGLMMNSKRHKRKTDTYRKSLITALAVSVIGLSIFAIFLI